MTGGLGPDACIDAVGMEAHAPGLVGAYDRVKQAAMLETDRPHALRQAIMACCNGGTVSVAGVYGGGLHKRPFGSLMNQWRTLRRGPTPAPGYMRPRLARSQKKDFDPRTGRRAS